MSSGEYEASLGILNETLESAIHLPFELSWRVVI